MHWQPRAKLAQPLANKLNPAPNAGSLFRSRPGNANSAGPGSMKKTKETEEVYSDYVPCPRCGARGAERVVFTFWGSFYGPALFTHVQCPKCYYKYNGKTGKSNRIPAILFVSIPLILILAIIGGVVFLAVSLSRGP
jgi:rubredoxin